MIIILWTENEYRFARIVQSYYSWEECKKLFDNSKVFDSKQEVALAAMDAHESDPIKIEKINKRYKDIDIAFFGTFFYKEASAYV